MSNTNKELRKITRSHQITLPRDYLKKHKVNVGDYMEVEIHGNRVVLIPHPVNSDDNNES